MSRGLDAELLHEQRPAGRDRGLGELQLADVALREVDGPLEVALLPPVQDEHALAVLQRHDARGEAGRELGRLLGVREAPGVIEQAALGELGHGVDQAGAADADGLDLADHAQVERAAVDLDDLDGAVGGAHAAADLRRLEGRTGRRRRREDALLAAERDLAVRADVDEQAQPLVAVHAGREQAGHDVAADVRAERREHAGGRVRVDGDAEVGGAQARVVARGHDERRDADRLGVDAQRELGHRRVAGERDLVHLVRLHAALLADLLRQRGRASRARAAAGAPGPCRPASSRRCAR